VTDKDLIEIEDKIDDKIKSCSKSCVSWYTLLFIIAAIIGGVWTVGATKVDTSAFIQHEDKDLASRKSMAYAVCQTNLLVTKLWNRESEPSKHYPEPDCRVEVEKITK